MGQETGTITVPIYRHDGRHVCMKDGIPCRFLKTFHFGQKFICGLTDKELFYDDEYNRDWLYATCGLVKDVL